MSSSLSAVQVSGSTPIQVSLSSPITILSLAPAQLVDGHKYLVFARAEVSCDPNGGPLSDNSATTIYAESSVGGGPVETTYNEITNFPTGNSESKLWSVTYVIQATATTGVYIRAHALSVLYDPAFIHNYSIIAIDLDSDPLTFMQGRDFEASLSSGVVNPNMTPRLHTSLTMQRVKAGGKYLVISNSASSERGMNGYPVGVMITAAQDGPDVTIGSADRGPTYVDENHVVNTAVGIFEAVTDSDILFKAKVYTLYMDQWSQSDATNLIVIRLDSAVSSNVVRSAPRDLSFGWNTVCSIADHPEDGKTLVLGYLEDLAVTVGGSLHSYMPNLRVRRNGVNAVASLFPYTFGMSMAWPTRNGLLMAGLIDTPATYDWDFQVENLWPGDRPTGQQIFALFGLNVTGPIVEAGMTSETSVSASARPERILDSAADASVQFDGSTVLRVASHIASSSTPRVFFSSTSGMSPKMVLRVALRGLAAKTNYLTPSSEFSFGITAGTYHAYSFDGPPVTSGPLYLLGFQKGDKIALTSLISGSGENASREFTIVDPAALVVLEPISAEAVPSVYEFLVHRYG